MTTYYLEYEDETIERITEQMIEEEYYAIIDEIEADVVNLGEEVNGDIHFNEGDNVDEVICSTEDKGVLGNNYVDVKNLYEDTVYIIQDTSSKIETSIRQYINDNGYVIGVKSDDGNGNIVFDLVKEAN